MKTEVELQKLQSFKLWPVVVSMSIVLGVVLIIISVLVYRVIKKKQAEKKMGVVLVKSMDLPAIKAKYLEVMSGIESSYNAGALPVRETYQQMSTCIRDFVYEVTNIDVRKYTLMDIKQLRMSALEELITEYYSPEFAEDSEADVPTSIVKTKRAIETWK